jgi:hypothetical protein
MDQKTLEVLRAALAALDIAQSCLDDKFARNKCLGAMAQIRATIINEQLQDITE